MKTLIVYNKNGEVIFTQTNAIEPYYMKVEEIEESKSIIGIDLETKQLTTVDIGLSNSEKQKLTKVLIEKNKQYLLTHKLQEIASENEELNIEIKAEIKKIKSANIEILEYVNAIAEALLTK